MRVFPLIDEVSSFTSEPSYLRFPGFPLVPILSQKTLQLRSLLLLLWVMRVSYAKGQLGSGLVPDSRVLRPHRRP